MIVSLLLLLLLFAGCATNPTPPSGARPVAIVNVTLIDGSGSPPVAGRTVVIEGDRITAVGDATTLPRGATVVEGIGLTLAPGFIDTHNHSSGGLDQEPTASSQVSQGITTILVGQDGSSPYPIGAYLQQLERSPAAVNVATLVGHSTLREMVMTNDTDRGATADEIKRMTDLVRAGMGEGAFGLSTGLEYEEAKKSTTEEVIALAAVAAAGGGIYVSHVRDEAQKTFESFDEAIRIGEEARIPVQISHIKMGSVSVWGLAGAAIAKIEAARRRGLDITADCYPYDAWHSTIRVAICCNVLNS